MDFQKTNRYFNGVNNDVMWAGIIPACILGFVAFIAYCSEDMGVAGWCFALAVVSALGGLFYSEYRRKKLMVTDQEYDLMAMSQLSNVTPRALARLGLDVDEVREIAPIIFDGYSFDDCTRVKRGLDGFWRSDRYRAVQLFFSENEVHIYTFSYSTTYANMSENTDVYFYKDIVSVSTSTETTTINRYNGQNGMGTQVQYECFKLTTTGGTSLKVSIRDSANAQRSINAMRQLLRAKKQM